MSDGYAKTFKELMETVEWDQYGTGRDPRCADCMVHCGYEPTAVLDSTANFKNMWKSFMDTVGLSKPSRSKAAGGRLPMHPLPVLNGPSPSKLAAHKAAEEREAVGASRN
jgi:hypothetical protein